MSKLDDSERRIIEVRSEVDLIPFYDTIGVVKYFKRIKGGLTGMAMLIPDYDVYVCCVMRSRELDIARINNGTILKITPHGFQRTLLLTKSEINKIKELL